MNQINDDLNSWMIGCVRQTRRSLISLADGGHGYEKRTPDLIKGPQVKFNKTDGDCTAITAHLNVRVNQMIPTIIDWIITSLIGLERSIVFQENLLLLHWLCWCWHLWRGVSHRVSWLRKNCLLIIGLMSVEWNIVPDCGPTDASAFH